MTEYKAVLLGSASTLEELKTFQPQEYNTPEGSLIMLELKFAEAPTQAMVDEINTNCAEYNVTPWPGYSDVAVLNTSANTINLYWYKGLAWLPIIGVILLMTVLPALLGAFIWWILPEEITSMIEMLVMMLVMFLMMRMIQPMFMPSKEEPKKISESAA